jgi:DMSO/TMAO reductase YedYZ molybdopterin-dependent catalytic subunit
MAMSIKNAISTRGFVVGALAAGVMTAVMAVLRFTTEIVSLPEILGEAIIGVMPAPLFSAVLDLMQKAAKPTLYIGIFLGQIALGGLLGRWYAGGEAGWRRALKMAIVTWLVVGVVVLPVMGVGLFGSAVRAGPVVVGAQMLIAFLSFAAALVLISQALESPAAAEQAERRADRRAALAKLGAGVAVIAVGGYAWRALPAADAPASSAAAPAPGPDTGGAADGSVAGSAASGPAASAPASAPAASAAGPAAAPGRGVPPLDAPAVPMTVAPNAPAPAPFAVPNLTPEVLTAKDFYTVSKNLIDPSVEVASWKLTVDGLVERPTTLTYTDISGLPAHSDYYTLQCISNLVGGDLWGNAHWKGVRLVDLLTRTGLKPGIRKLIFHAADDYTDSIPIDVALRPDTLLAYEMNSEPLTKEHGFPARLLIPGIYGMKNVKWITRIEAVDYDYKGYWMQRGWSDKATYQTSSRIDAPRNRATLPVGEISLAGVAFAGHRGIDKVEVSLDDGKTWQGAEIKPALSQNAWNLWGFRTNAEGGTYPVKVRATDGTGEVQTPEIADPLPDGATGYHSILLRVG